MFKSQSSRKWTNITLQNKISKSKEKFDVNTSLNSFKSGIFEIVILMYL